MINGPKTIVHSIQNSVSPVRKLSNALRRCRTTEIRAGHRHLLQVQDASQKPETRKSSLPSTWTRVSWRPVTIKPSRTLLPEIVLQWAAAKEAFSESVPPTSLSPGRVRGNLRLSLTPVKLVLSSVYMSCLWEELLIPPHDSHLSVPPPTSTTQPDPISDLSLGISSSEAELY